MWIRYAKDHTRATFSPDSSGEILLSFPMGKPAWMFPVVTYCMQRLAWLFP